MSSGGVAIDNRHALAPSPSEVLFSKICYPYMYIDFMSCYLLPVPEPMIIAGVLI